MQEGRVLASEPYAPLTVFSSEKKRTIFNSRRGICPSCFEWAGHIPPMPHGFTSLWWLSPYICIGLISVHFKVLFFTFLWSFMKIAFSIHSKNLIRFKEFTWEDKIDKMVKSNIHKIKYIIHNLLIVLFGTNLVSNISIKASKKPHIYCNFWWI